MILLVSVKMDISGGAVELAMVVCVRPLAFVFFGGHSVLVQRGLGHDFGHAAGTHNQAVIMGEAQPPEHPMIVL